MGTTSIAALAAAASTGKHIHDLMVIHTHTDDDTYTLMKYTHILTLEQCQHTGWCMLTGAIF